MRGATRASDGRNARSRTSDVSNARAKMMVGFGVEAVGASRLRQRPDLDRNPHGRPLKRQLIDVFSTKCKLRLPMPLYLG